MSTSRDARDRTGRGAEGVCFERLEGRMLLSGNVTAVVSGGNLTLAGDDQGNEILIDQVGVGADEVRISGVGTTVNDQAGPVTISGVTGNVLVRMGRGNDVVQIQDADLPGSLSVNDIRGNNELVLDAAAVAGGLRVAGKRGDQTVRVVNGSDIARSANIDNDRGDNLTQVLASEVGGQLSISGKQGVETVEMDGVIVGSHVKVRHLKGDTDVAIHDADIGGHLMVLTGKDGDTVVLGGASEVDGKVDVNIKDGGGSVDLAGTVCKLVKVLAGKGTDEIALTGLTARRGVLIHTGDGEDLVTIDDVTVTRALDVNTGKDDDTVLIETLGADPGPRSQFNGNVQIGTFSGDDTVTVGVAGEDGNSADFDGRLRLDGGPDTDTADLLNNDNTFGGDLEIKNFETTG